MATGYFKDVYGKAPIQTNQTRTYQEINNDFMTMLYKLQVIGYGHMETMVYILSDGDKRFSPKHVMKDLRTVQQIWHDKVNNTIKLANYKGLMASTAHFDALHVALDNIKTIPGLMCLERLNAFVPAYRFAENGSNYVVMLVNHQTLHNIPAVIYDCDSSLGRLQVGKKIMEQMRYTYIIALEDEGKDTGERLLDQIAEMELGCKHCIAQIYRNAPETFRPSRIVYYRQESDEMGD